MDAIRVADGKVVAIKMVDKTYHPDETAITKLFSTEPVASLPFNHTVPLYDAFPSLLYDIWCSHISCYRGMSASPPSGRLWDSLTNCLR